MADETQRRIIYLEINATKAVDGSTAATRALASVEKGASSAGAAMGALEAASVAAGGAAQRTALDLATSATAATNLNAAYRTTAGGVLELARATTVAATSARAQAAGFARLAEQRTVQASLAETRALMDGVARSTASLTQMYGAATTATTTFANAQAQAAGYAKLAQQSMIDAATAKSRATMAAVDSVNPEHIKSMYFGGAGVPTPAASGRPSVGYMGTPGQTGLNAQQKVMLGYQLQDVGVSLIGGMNPFVVAAQQGPQISMLYGGVRNMLAAIPKPALVAGGAAVGGLAMGAVLKEISEINEALEMQQRRLAAVFGPGDQAARVYRDIGRMASGTAISIAEATEAVMTFGRATRELGGSGQTAVELATMAEKLSRLSGASKEEGGAARNALADMFKESAVSADQLRTVLSNVPQIADKIAEGLGISVSQLKLMTQQGDLTGRQVFSALRTQTEAVNKEFEDMPKSLGFVLKSIGIEIGEMVTSLAAAAGQLTVIKSRADAIRAAHAANANRPKRATPRVIGNPGVDFSDAALEEDIAGGMMASLQIGNAVTAGADAAVLAASKLAQGLDPVVTEVKQFHRGITETELALGKLEDGLTSFDASKAAQETKTLTANLQALREKADAAGSAYYQALSAVQLRQQQDELGMSPGQRAYAANVANLAKPGSGVSIGEAQDVADAQQLSTLGEMVKAKQMEADASTRALEAVRKGKAATVEAKVEAAVLAFVWANVGKNVDVTAEQIKAYGDAVRTILKNDDAMGGVNATKPLLDDLAAIAEAMKVVEQGAYAMKRAEAATKAARSEDGTGSLQMEVFDARQALTDATTLQNLREETDLTNALAKAAGNITEQKRLQLEFDIKRAQLNAAPGARAGIDEAMRVNDAAKQALSLADGAAALERQVVFTRQQIELVRSGSPDFAAQLASLQKANELRAQGIDIEADANAQRQIAAAGNLARANTELERAREAADGTKRIWQNALDGVQSYGADVFFDIFSGAEVNGADVAKSMKNIFIRAFAEIAAAAVIKPLISPVFEVGQQLGIVPAGVGGAAWGGAPSAANSNGIGIPGGASLGWFGDSFKGVGNWLKSPITGGGYGAYNTASDVASLTGTAMPQGMSPSGMGFLGGTTWGQGLGALGGLGMGAFQLASANGNTAKTIGGIGSMVGAAVSLIPGVGQIAGPIISLASSLIPGLCGGDEYKWDPMAGGNTRFTPGVKKPTIHSTEINGGESIGGRYARTWGVIDELLRATGGTIDPGRAYSGDIWNNQRDGYSSVALIGPDGQSRILGGGEGDRSQDLDTLIASVFSANVKYGGLTGISDTLMKAVNNREPGNEQEVRDLLSLIDAYDKFGKVIPTAKPALEEIAKKFATMTETARLYGLVLDPIAAEQKKVTERYARDFIDGFVDPLAVELRALDDERKDAIASAEYIRDHVANVYVDINKITETFLTRETELREKAYDGALKSLDDAIRRMTPGGDLANLNDTATLAGLKATFGATSAQAMAGNSAALARIAGEGTALAEYGSRYYGGNADYNALRDEILGIFMQVQAQLQPSTSAPAGQSGQADPNAAANSQQFQQLMAAFQRSTEDNDNLRAEITRLTGLVTRLLGRAA